MRWLLALAAVCCLAAPAVGFTPCDISGNWSEGWGQTLSNQTDMIAFDAAAGTFTVSNYPAQYWQHGNGTVDFANGRVYATFLHNPYPSGKRVDLTGTIIGSSCPDISIVWDNGSVWCMRRGSDQQCHGLPPAPLDPKKIRTVHVVQSAHLDVGFADSAPGIVNRWFDHHFPMMLAVSQELRTNRTLTKNTNAKLQFMTQSYLVSLYLDCPAGMGIHCPTPAQQQAFRQGLANGDVYYHAFPFNAELELYSPLFVNEGLELTHQLDKDLGLAPKRTLSQRDVPGTTRSIIPILRSAGVDSITVGVNTASSYPAVPKVFVWQEPSDAAPPSPSTSLPSNAVLAMWHPRGYGGIAVEDAVMVEGFEHALVFDWNGDNAGPYDAEQYVKNFESIQNEFPNAQVVSSTFDNFTSLLLGSGLLQELPVVTTEIGDTWIHGCPSDPRKVWTTNAFNRAWDRYAQDGGKRDAVYLNATRLALKNGEHTWGRDVKSNLKDNTDWANKAFDQARTTGPAADQFAILEESWWTQRSWGIDFALQALRDASHPLLGYIEQELARLTSFSSTQPNPVALNYTRLQTPSVTIDGKVSIAFSPSTGAITSLKDLHSSAQLDWASDTNTLFGLEYQTYSQTNFIDFMRAYSGFSTPPDWALHDFGKPNDTISEYGTYGSQFKSAWYKPSCQGPNKEAASCVLVELGMQSTGSVEYGLPQSIWVEYAVLSATSSLSMHVTVSMYNKTPTRLPEAMFVVFNPVGSDKGRFVMDKLGKPVAAGDTTDGGSHHIHGVSSVQFTPANGHSSILSIAPIDAPIVRLGQRSAFPTPIAQKPDMSQGFSSMLWDNIWGTNYIMWWPFNKNKQPVPEEASILFAYSVTASS